MEPAVTPGKTPRKSFGTKQQQMLAFFGLVLFLTGLVATALLGQFNPITAILCVVGILVGSVIFLPRVTRNLTVYANMLLYSFFFCAAAVVFFMILQKHPMTYDATQSRNFSLSGVTANFLQRLDQPVRATAFVRNKQDRMSASLLLGEYSRYSENFDYRIVDPFMETGVAREYGAEVLPGDVFIERLTTNTQQAERVKKVGKLNEEQITNGIVQLLRDRDLTLYFTIGHGEPALAEDKVSAALMGQEPDPNNLQALTDQLKRSYINVVPLELDRRQNVPTDASAVIVVRPRIDFSPAETRSLRTYLEQGGRVIFLLNPDIPQLGNEVRTSLTNLASLIKEYGVDLPPNVIVMPLAQQSGQSIYITPVEPLEHRITQDFRTGEPILMFEQARPVQVGTSPQSTFLEPFLQSGPEAWPFPIDELQRALLTRTDPQVAPNVDDLKPITVGVAATQLRPERGEEGASKIIVVGNGNFVTTRFLSNQGWLVFMNAVNWLTDSGELIAIPSSEIQNTPSILTPGQRQFLFILVVIAVPTLIALGGLGYSISRRGTLQ